MTGSRWCGGSVPASHADDPGSIPGCGTHVMCRPSGATDEAPGHVSSESKVSLGGEAGWAMLSFDNKA